ncbi:MAG: ABC transporter substrate-binding protein [Nitrospiria bacterium]
MKRFFLFFLLILNCFHADPAEGRSLDRVSEKRVPQRIVSLTLGTDEILLSLVDPKRILAVTRFAADPAISNVAEAARAIPNKISQAGAEQVVALAPDMVLAASYTSADVVKQLTDVGLPLVRLELFSSIEGIKENIRAVGLAVGAPERAEEIIAKMDRRLRNLSEPVSTIEDRPAVLSYGPDGSTAGRETTFDEMVARAGGRNLAAEAGLIGHRKISLETVVTLDPEVIILSAWQPEAPNFEHLLLTHPALKGVSAVKEKRVYVIPERQLTTVSQYIVDGTEALARLIHPALFKPTLFEP